MDPTVKYSRNPEEELQFQKLVENSENEEDEAVDIEEE